MARKKNSLSFGGGERVYGLAHPALSMLPESDIPAKRPPQGRRELQGRRGQCSVASNAGLSSSFLRHWSELQFPRRWTLSADGILNY